MTTHDVKKQGTAVGLRQKYGDRAVTGQHTRHVFREGKAILGTVPYPHAYSDCELKVYNLATRGGGGKKKNWELNSA